MLTEPKAKVDLLVLQDALEAIAVRGMLEYFGIEVRCHFIGNVKKLVSLLSEGEKLHEIVLLSCHGNEKGILLPELHESLEKEMPYHHILTASDCLQFLKLKDQIIINTGCFLGKQGFAKSFLDKGASVYIGAENEPEGNAVVFFVISLLYFFLCEGLSLREAFDKTSALSQEDLRLDEKEKV